MLIVDLNPANMSLKSVILPGALIQSLVSVAPRPSACVVPSPQDTKYTTVVLNIVAVLTSDLRLIAENQHLCTM